MALNSDVANQLPRQAMAIYGETGSYHDTSEGTDTNITLIADRGSRRPVFEPDATSERLMMDFLVKVADVASPADAYLSAAQDYIVFEGTTWYVNRILERNVGGLHRLQCSTSPLRSTG